MSNSILSMKDVKVAYGDHIVLDNFNVDIAQGEFVGIIGPNGTGKSTLIKAITKIIEAKEGTIYIDGKNNRDLSRKERAKLVSVVPQEFTIDFDFNSYDIVMMGRNPHYTRNSDAKKDHEIVKNAMMVTNTWKFKERMFNEMSGGERQRVIIARAIAQETKMILLDEPTSHLDIHHQLEVLELIKKLKDEKNITVLAVLHDINMAARFSDRLVLLHEKKVMVDGAPEEVISKKHLGKVYEMEMVVRTNKLLSTKEVVPIRVLKEYIIPEDVHIHVISGGGCGEEIIERLNSMGAHLSCGVLNKGDSDWEMCKMLGIDCIEEVPFSPIQDITHELHKERIKNVDAVLVVSDVPFGSGNLRNLEVLMQFKKPIYMLRRTEPYDYTEGEASALMGELEKKANFQYVKNIQEFIQKISEGAKNEKTEHHVSRNRFFRR
ncbi:MAG TPA: ABC transporter [Eubacteriaceae bacterium]|nr:ABC transporter [Eubacteriaceae bacterium]